MNVSIIIPNYNGEDLLKKNLPKVQESVKHYKDRNKDSMVEIIVVDDHSADGSIKVLENYEDIKVIRNSKNLGFSSAVNRGVEEAKGEIVVLLNTDVVPQKNFLEPLLRHFADRAVFAVGCMDRSIENGKIVLRGRGIGRWEKGFLIHARGEVNKTTTLWVNGGSGAFRRSIWDKLGGFNELYNPFYYEDIDLSYASLKAGYTIRFEPRSVVVHDHHEGAIKKFYSPFQIKTIAYRNQFIFVWKNATDLDVELLHILWLPYHLTKALLRVDLPFFLGFFQAFIRFPKVIQSSLSAQKLFVRSDHEVIKEFI